MSPRSCPQAIRQITHDRFPLLLITSSEKLSETGFSSQGAWQQSPSLRTPSVVSYEVFLLAAPLPGRRGPSPSQLCAWPSLRSCVCAHQERGRRSLHGATGCRDSARPQRTKCPSLSHPDPELVKTEEGMDRDENGCFELTFIVKKTCRMSPVEIGIFFMTLSIGLRASYRRCYRRLSVVCILGVTFPRAPLHGGWGRGTQSVREPSQSGLEFAFLSAVSTATASYRGREWSARSIPSDTKLWFREGRW